MFRVRAADDFATIRARQDELRAERERPKHPEDKPSDRAQRFTLRRLLARTGTLPLDGQLRRRLRASWKR